MAALTLRLTKGSPLTNLEIDTNFSNLNTEVETKLATASYTAADVLTKIKTVDGSGSGLDADLLDGLNQSSANTVSTIVARDASGDIYGTVFHGALTGNVTGTVSGNAGTVTNGLYSTSSYSNPSWITTLATSKLTGTIPNSSLSNSAITINGASISLGGSVTTPTLSGDNTWTGTQSFTDTLFQIKDDIDPTKIFKIQASNIGSGLTRTLTIPNEDGTIATQAWVGGASVLNATNLTGGRCLIGNGSAASPSLAFINDGAVDTGFYWGGDGYTFFANNGVKSGQIAPGGTLTMVGNVLAYSDERLKENIVTVDGALEKVSQLRGVFYNKINDKSKTKKLGVIAQEVQAIVPEVVIADADGMLAVDYGNIVGLLIEAIKELQLEVQELKGKL